MLKFISKISKKIDKIFFDKILPVLMLAVVLNLSFPHISVAQSLEQDQQSQVLLPLQAGDVEILKSVPQDPTLQPKKVITPKKVVKIWVTAYNSLPAQTDDDPCTTASGLNVCQRNTEDVIATNFQYLPFGTKVRLPELYGDKVFTVEDRMHYKYHNSADIWFKSHQAAIEFGRKYTTMEIL